ncbi:hypothetical protein [Arthrobacter sp. 92]|uniref:hypothetical protein n=1 Tax=Arthrobacter sp. 92 TaxID=3418175 RepID=UPI003D015C98
MPSRQFQIQMIPRFIGRNWKYVTSYAGTAAVILGGGLVAILPVFLEKDQPKDWGSDIVTTACWIGVGVALAAVGSIGQSASLLKLRKTLDDSTRQATVAEAVAMRSVIHRNLERLEAIRRVSTSQSEAKRLAEYSPLVADVLGKLQGYFERGGTPVKVNYYRLTKDDAGNYRLEVVDKTFSVRRAIISGDVAEDRPILVRTLRGGGEYCPDMDDSVWHDDGSHEPHTPAARRDYRCYASVAAVVDGNIHGMLSMNTPTPKGLPEKLALEYLEVLGLILAVAESSLGLSQPHRLGEPIGMSEVESMVEEQ